MTTPPAALPCPPDFSKPLDCAIGFVERVAIDRRTRRELAGQAAKIALGAREELAALRKRVAELEAAIQRALADSESGTGWGPDVTVCASLRKALQP